MALRTPSTLYFVVMDRRNKIYGYTWRIGTSGTSFYIKARANPIGALKISLHGPDSRSNLGPPGFKLAVDQSALPKVYAAQGGFVGNIPRSGLWFPGRAVNDHVTHVATFRSTPDLFGPGVPSAPSPGSFDDAKEQGLIASAPKLLEVADIDIYVSNGAPYWWNDSRAFKDRSCFGPIRNKAGQYLTCQSMRRSIEVVSREEAPKPKSLEDRTRGLRSLINQSGVLEVQELWISRAFILRGVPKSKRPQGKAVTR